MIRIAALICGLLCGIGLVVSGLFRPAMLQEFANPAGPWYPALGLGLLAAILAAFLAFLTARRLVRPVLGGQEEEFARGPMLKLVAGGVLFGLGWGLSGYFPLAALVSLGAFAPGAGIFLISVVGGMIANDLIANRGRLDLKRLRSMG